MIKAVRLQNEVTRKLHRIDSEYGKGLSIQEKDAAINEAKDLVYENFITRPEMNHLLRSHLRQLEVKRKELKSSGFDSVSDVAEFPEDYFRTLRVTIEATTKTCSTSRELMVHILQSHKLSETLKSPNWEPSFEWEETIGDEAEGGLHIWHNKKFTIDKVYLDYMKEIPDIYTPSMISPNSGPYKNPDGEEVTKDRDLIIDSTALWRKIVDVAVLILQRDLSDAQGFQSQVNKIMTTEQVYK